MYEAMMPTRRVVSHEQEQIKCPWRTLLPWQHSQVMKLLNQNPNPFTYSDSKCEKRSHWKLVCLIVGVKKKKSETLSGDGVLWNQRWEKKGWKRTQRRVSWLRQHRTVRLTDLACWRCEDAAGVKATKASPRCGKWVQYNQQELRGSVFGGLNEQRPNLTAVRVTAGSVNVNKLASNTTWRDAARKRSSIIVGSSGMMWLSTLSVIVINVGWFSTTWARR